MVMRSAYVPDKNDIVWIDLNPTRGHEQANVRPVIVLSPRSYNQKLGLLVGCPITSHAKGYPFEVAILEKNVTGVILTDQIRSMDWRSRNIKFIQKAKESIVDEVAHKIKLLLFG